MTVKALVVHPDETTEVRDIEPTLEGIKGIIGGWLEAIYPAGSDYGHWHGYVDEEGKLKGLEVNTYGTHIARQLGWPNPFDVLCGPVVFLGSGGTGEDEGAEEADVPDKVLEFINQRAK